VGGRLPDQTASRYFASFVSSGACRALGFGSAGVSGVDQRVAKPAAATRSGWFLMSAPVKRNMRNPSIMSRF